MIPANVKANKTKRNIKGSGGCIFYIYCIFYKKYLQNLCKKAMYFSFDFGWYYIHFDIVR